jgi:type II secretory pathway pseudopilin PulG
LAREAIKRRVDRQKGASLLLFVVGILLVAATIFALKLLVPAKRGAIQAEATTANFEVIQIAIVAYVAANGRMPCPANPTAANDGTSSPATPNTNCTYQSGVVPWATLGISPDTALDGWNRRISYRVFDSATGLTQDGGASMTNCDSFYPYGSPPTLPANGLCPDTHVNTEEQFLNAKGLTVSDYATSKTGVAYILISHGESGYGAYLPGGVRMQMPSGDELTNTGITGPFVKKAHSDANVDPSLAAHFDDVIAWVSISDLIKKSGRGARDWQDSGSPVQITPETTTNMNVAGPGHFNAAGTPGAVDRTDTIPDAIPFDTLAFVAVGRGAACIWWPTSFKVYNSLSMSRYAIRLYLEYSTTTGSGEFGGFTVGFLPKAPTDALIASGTPFTSICGDTTSSSGIGWSNGATSQGNLPTPRFAVETDTAYSFTYHDPFYNHLAIDFSNVSHGTTATSCSLFSNTYHTTGANKDCYTGPSNIWLRDGLSNFHRMRIEVYPRDPACSGGAAPRLKVWVLPQSLCPNDSAASICADAKNLLTTFSPTAPLPAGAVAIESCIPVPTTSTDLDDLYFGMTASSRLGASGPLQYIRNLGAAAYLMP